MSRERSTRRKEYELTRDTGKIKLQKQRKKDYWRGRENTVQETGGGSKWTQRFWGL